MADDVQWRSSRRWRVAPLRLEGEPMRTLSAISLPLIVAGCFGPPSHVDSNATLAVGGAAERQSGDADASAKVLLVRHPDALQAIGDAREIVGGVGRACVAGNDSWCSPFAQATGGSDGTYTFPPLRGADTKGSTGQALLFTAWLSGPAPTAPATARAGVGA